MAICDTISLFQKKRTAFHLHIEAHEDHPLLLPPEPRLRKLKHYQKTAPVTVSLKELLEDPALRKHSKPSQAVRLRLAKILACSLFQLYESPWSSSRWQKENITFFLASNGKSDYDNPYLNTRFDQMSFEEEAFNPQPMHQKVGVLKLGILLLELYKWKSIENLVKEKDHTGGLLDTYWFAATRLLERYQDRLPIYFESEKSRAF